MFQQSSIFLLANFKIFPRSV